MKNFLPLKTGILATLILGGCIATSMPYMRGETAQRIAAPAWMIKRDIPADPYLLRAYERIHDRGGIANVYIEGDGPSVDPLKDPTPTNPVALHLASKDNAKNLVYIARPCQFNGRIEYPHDCNHSEWQDARFSRDVIDSYEKALDDISARYRIKGFNLVGYSGGAAIAAIIAAERKDILSLRTVSGVLDHNMLQSLSGKPPLTESINPIEKASDLVRMPQYHFIGGQDNAVPPAILNSYLQAIPPSTCIQTLLVQEAEHEAGWVDKWPELLALPVTCSKDNADPDALYGDIDNDRPRPLSPTEDIRSFDNIPSLEKP